MTIDTPPQMADLMRQCKKLTDEYVWRCNDTFGLRLPLFRVEFTLRGTTAGKAKIGRGVIQYNPTLLRENPDAFLGRTVGHEVVHHAAYALHGMGIKSHGTEWQSMMWKLGLPNTRCHSYDTSNVPTKVGKMRNTPNSSGLRIHDGRVRSFGLGKVTLFD